MWQITPDGVATYLSNVARDIFGLDPAAMVGHSVFVLLPAPDQDQARRLLADAVRERCGWQGLRFEARTGTGSRERVQAVLEAWPPHAVC